MNQASVNQARKVFEEAKAEIALSGLELKGPMSDDFGFLPRFHPELRLPETHVAWDQLASMLPGENAQLHNF